MRLYLWLSYQWPSFSSVPSSVTSQSPWLALQSFAREIYLHFPLLMCLSQQWNLKFYLYSIYSLPDPIELGCRLLSPSVQSLVLSLAQSWEEVMGQLRQVSPLF